MAESNEGVNAFGKLNNSLEKILQTWGRVEVKEGGGLERARKQEICSKFVHLSKYVKTEI